MTTPRAVEEQDKRSMVTVFYPTPQQAEQKARDCIGSHLTEILEFAPVIYTYTDGAVDILSTGHMATKAAAVVWLVDRFTKPGQKKPPHKALVVIGDSDNDIPMLVRSAVTHVACPANATPAVKELVEKRSGYVAKERYGLGTLEALGHLVDAGALPEFRKALVRRAKAVFLSRAGRSTDSNGEQAEAAGAEQEPGKESDNGSGGPKGGP
jgi:hydroxymethylpyrimidine pyrophosphatase-like HAD family hydrolase